MPKDDRPSIYFGTVESDGCVTGVGLRSESGLVLTHTGFQRIGARGRLEVMDKLHSFLCQLVVAGFRIDNEGTFDALRQRYRDQVRELAE